MAAVIGRQRWGEGTRHDEAGQGRARILAAAVCCYEQQGIAATTIEDVAQAAQISRRTVYRYFPSRQAIIQAVVEQQATAFFDELRDFASRHEGDFRSLLVDTMLFAIEHGPRMAGHQLLLQGSNALNTAQYYLGTNLMQQWEAILATRFAAAQAAGEIPASIRLPALVEWMGRLVLSWIQYPASQTSAREMVSMLLLPGMNPGTD